MTVGKRSRGGGASAPQPRRHKKAADVVPEDVGDLDFGRLPRLVGYVLRRSQLAVFQSFNRTFAEVDLRPTQFTVLTIIGLNPGLKQSQVSAALGIKKTNFVALLDSLEQRGLATRQPTASDRRSYALYLTDEGKALVETANRLVERHEEELAKEIGEENRDVLLDLLDRLCRAATAATSENGDER